MIKQIIKFFTPKDWKYYNYVPNPEMYEYDHPYYKYRVCTKTGTLQHQDVHCLGLCPPTYVNKWYNTHKKPKLFYRGGVWVVDEKGTFDT